MKNISKSLKKTTFKRLIVSPLMADRGVNMNYMIRMRNLRENNDLTQQEVAAILETSQTMYARYERGANEMPIHHLIKLAKYYDVSTDYLLGLTKTKASFPKE